MATGNSVVQRVPQPHGGTLVPFAKGKSGNPGGLSKERRELYEAIERSQVPKVLQMLDALFDRGIAGDDFAAKEWLAQVRGPVKARDDDAIASAVQEQLMALIHEARRRRAEATENGDAPTG